MSGTGTTPDHPWRYLSRYKGHVVIGIITLLTTTACAVAIPKLLGKVIDALQGDNPAEAVPPLALAMIAFAVAQAITRIASRVALFHAARKAEYDLRSQLFAHLLRLDAGFYREHNTGDLMSRLVNDVQTVRAMWGPGLLNIVNTVFAFTAVLVPMTLMDPALTMWAVVPFPSMVIFGQFFSRRLYQTSRRVTEQLGNVSSSIQEDLTGIGVIKTYNLEANRRDHFEKMSSELMNRNLVLARVRGQLIPSLTGLASLSTVIVLWVGGQAVIDDELTVGQLIEFIGYLGMLVWPTLALGWMMSLLARGKASWKRVRDLLETEPAVADTGTRTEEIAGDLEIRDLSIEIDGHKILDQVSLMVPAGSTTAIVGRTGSGKSTLVDVVPRLAEVPAGTVLIDGEDISTLPLERLRAAIGYAPQEAFLFSRSIADNIAFGLSDESNRVAEIAKAAQTAGLTRDLDALPAGLDTVVGERGITLSGGQRQRVALARAVASQPKVLILDDSLSSVDAQTEREILGHLGNELEGRTALLISHRVAAVRQADQIVVLDEGRVVERGTHRELLDAGGVYSELYQSQLADQVLTGTAEDSP